MAEDPLLFMESNPQVGRERNTMSPDHEIENLGYDYLIIDSLRIVGLSSRVVVGVDPAGPDVRGLQYN